MKRHLGYTNIQPISVNDSTATAAESDWVSLTNYDSVIFVIVAEVGATADNTAFTVREATTNGGAGSKDLAVRRGYRKEHASALSASGAYTEVAPTSNAVTLDGDAENVLLFEVTGDELDVNNGFKFVTLRHDGGGAATKTFTAIAILGSPRYAVEPSEWPAVDA